MELSQVSLESGERSNGRMMKQPKTMVLLLKTIGEMRTNGTLGEIVTHHMVGGPAGTSQQSVSNNAQFTQNQKKLG